MVWYFHLFKNFPVSCDQHSQRLFSIVNEAEVDFFLILLLFLWPNKCFQFDLWFSKFCKPSFYIRKFSGHVLLKPSLKDFEHYLASRLNEYKCAVLWTFFGIAFLWDWNEDWLFQSCGHCWAFQICWDIECNTLAAVSFRICSSSAGISSPLLDLFVVIFPKAYWTSYSRISGSRWVATPSWLSR